MLSMFYHFEFRENMIFDICIPPLVYFFLMEIYSYTLGNANIM